MNLKPLHDRVIVERREKETTTASGIVLASSAAEKPSEGVVVAVGPGKSHDGKIQPLTVKEGNRVLFGKFTGSEVKVDGKDYVIMREDEIFAIIE